MDIISAAPRIVRALSLITVVSMAGGATAKHPDPTLPGQPQGGPPQRIDWRAEEAADGLLTDHVQLTSRDRFVKAGEAYFNTGASWVIFQAVPVPPEGQPEDLFYSMYVAKVVRDGAGKITGLGEPILLSNPGSANTCGWFHPKLPGVVLFGSTIAAPATEQKSGFKVRPDGKGGEERKYEWLFPQETEIVTMTVPAVWSDSTGKPVRVEGPFRPEAGPSPAAPLFESADYDAEASWSPDGRYVLYTAVRPERTGDRPDGDIWMFDSTTGKRTAIVTADGYDGGPFFSPDGKWICYRSDRKLNDRLQLFVAKLKFEGDACVGIEAEYALTDNEHVNWAPFFHPSGGFIVYGTSEVGHWNYEVFAVEFDPAKLRAGAKPGDLAHRRITHANGADIMPVFSPDGRWLLWTAQRGPMAPGETKPSSQVWTARWLGGAGMPAPKGDQAKP